MDAASLHARALKPLLPGKLYEPSCLAVTARDLINHWKPCTMGDERPRAGVRPHCFLIRFRIVVLGDRLF